MDKYHDAVKTGIIQGQDELTQFISPRVMWFADWALLSAQVNHWALNYVPTSNTKPVWIRLHQVIMITSF